MKGRCSHRDTSLETGVVNEREGEGSYWGNLLKGWGGGDSLTLLRGCFDNSVVHIDRNFLSAAEDFKV
jgi:hypothetical protein